MTKRPIKFGILGIDHRHIYGMCENTIVAGGECVGWHTVGEPATLAGFVRRFPDIPRLANADEILSNPDVDLILCAAIPRDRASIAIAAMRAGKDVMVDKPGCTTFEQLEDIREVQKQSDRIWSVNFSERFEVPAVTKAIELTRGGAIGDVLNIVGLGPHRANLATRPDWFFARQAYGGVLCDIASHQIDQFLAFTGSTSAEIVSARAENLANPKRSGFQDFGEIMLRAGSASGYIRVDWFTPNALPTWGDGRLFVTGSQGYIELRKYVDVGHSTKTNSLILVNGEHCELIDASDAGLPYFARLLDDVSQRTETAMPQAHAFEVMRLALLAQSIAESTSA